MTTTYTKTTMIDDLKLATVTMFVYDKCKYVTNDEPTEMRFTNMTSWSVVSGDKDAESLEAILNDTEIDEYHEYLILHFADNSVRIFKNSHVDMFIR